MDSSGNGEPKPYHCDVCGDDFKRHEHLIRHSRRHTQEKPFKCDVCQKEFARRDILSRHAIVHVPAAERAAMPQKTQKRGTKRVQQACNNCAKGKCRCDGETPCSTCQSKGFECEYTLASTPAKRRRADSSASTAAANALMQVASSAHASPKGDWTMDYNGHPSDASMQPHHTPIVFGYQPSLNGGATHEGFMYGQSRPGSHYASRVPSPSLAYDTTFDTASPAASKYAFLFKEAARDLPGIKVILNRSMPASVYGADFNQSAYGHNALEQPGSYSNYRNDALTNPDSNRASSPIAAFPDVDIPESYQRFDDIPVSEFTQDDHIRISAFAGTRLPSVKVLNVLIGLFFTEFHDALPVLHRPSFNVRSKHPILVLAVMLLGSRYLTFLPYAEFYSPLRKILEIELKKDAKSDSLDFLHAQLYVDIADLYDIESQAKLDTVEERRSGLLRKARARKLFDQTYESPPETASPDVKWHQWASAEEKGRLSWAIFLYDNLFACLFDVRPLMEVNEVKTSLPCSATLWQAMSADAWTQVFAPERFPIRTRTLWSTGRLEERGAEECAQYGQFCRTILAYVEARRVQDRASSLPKVESVADNQFSARAEADEELYKIKFLAGLAFDVLELAAHSTPEQGDISATLLNLFFARMTIFVDLQCLRQYLIGNDRSVRLWIEQDVTQARAAVVLAAHILVICSQLRQSSPFAGMIAFYATVTLYCFAKFYHGAELSQTLELNNFGMQTAEIRQWCETGAFVPLVRDIGPLNQNSLPIILGQWSNSKSQLVWWGVDTLRDRVEFIM